MIPFNKPIYLKDSLKCMHIACSEQDKISGDGIYTKKVSTWLENEFSVKKALLTTSCSSALDMMAYLCDIGPGDEVVLPSYTFVSTANAFALRGATCVFVDIRPDTMNIDENLIEDAITKKTKAICVVHYAGVGCEMDAILHIAKKYNLSVLEDAAQGMMSTYKNRPLGTIGRMGSYSFHETKNYTMGEGGCLLLHKQDDIEKAEIYREKGTDRSRFLRGQVDKYTWCSIGSSYLPSDMNAAYLYPQLEIADKINSRRLQIWDYYKNALLDFEEEGILELPVIPDGCCHNAHMFYIKCKDIEERTDFIKYMKSKGILTVFHYIPLHSSTAGKKYGRFHGVDRYTTAESNRLVRLPLYYDLEDSETEYITDCIHDFYMKQRKKNKILISKAV